MLSFKTILVLVSLLGLCSALNPRLIGLYELKEEDLDHVLNDEFELEFYVDCVLDRGSCDANGNSMKGEWLTF